MISLLGDGSGVPLSPVQAIDMATLPPNVQLISAFVAERYVAIVVVQPLTDFVALFGLAQEPPLYPRSPLWAGLKG